MDSAIIEFGVLFYAFGRPFEYSNHLMNNNLIFSDGQVISCSTFQLFNNNNVIFFANPLLKYRKISFHRLQNATLLTGVRIPEILRFRDFVQPYLTRDIQYIVLSIVHTGNTYVVVIYIMLDKATHICLQRSFNIQNITNSNAIPILLAGSLKLVVYLTIHVHNTQTQRLSVIYVHISLHVT